MGDTTCKAELYIGDDHGDSHATMRCERLLEHGGYHCGGFSRREAGVAQQCVAVQWRDDERPTCKGCGVRMTEDEESICDGCYRSFCPACAAQYEGGDTYCSDCALKHPHKDSTDG